MGISAEAPARSSSKAPDPPVDNSGYLRLKAEIAPLPLKSTEVGSRLSRNYFADPEILHADSLYYLFITSGDSTRSTGATTAGLGIRCFSSSDLKNWRDRGLALDAHTSACTFTQNTIWAPQALRGPDDAYYLFYNASGPEYEKARKGGWASDSPYQRICVARSERPAGPYIEYAAPLFDGQEIPGYADGKNGVVGTIDAYALRDVNAEGHTRFYLYWSGINDEKNQNLLWGAELREDLRGLKLPPEGPEPRILIGEPMEEWEKKACGKRRIAEAASVVKRGGKYYLLYSANSFNTPEYATGYAIGDTPLGPFKRADNNPILKASPKWQERLRDRSTLIGPAGGSFLKDKQGHADRIVFASIDNQTTAARCDNDAGHCRNIRVKPIRFESDGALRVGN
ncbi:MAG: family 43 glycosylhydrolase [Candidatus Sumerlaeaceae bacterium]